MPTSTIDTYRRLRWQRMTTFAIAVPADDLASLSLPDNLKAGDLIPDTLDQWLASYEHPDHVTAVNWRHIVTHEPTEHPTAPTTPTTTPPTPTSIAGRPTPTGHVRLIRWSRTSTFCHTTPTSQLAALGLLDALPAGDTVPPAGHQWLADHETTATICAPDWRDLLQFQPIHPTAPAVGRTDGRTRITTGWTQPPTLPNLATLATTALRAEANTGQHSDTGQILAALLDTLRQQGLLR